MTINNEEKYLENEVNADNTRNTNNTTKRNGRVGVFRRVGLVRGGVGGLGRKRRSSEEAIQVKGKK